MIFETADGHNHFHFMRIARYSLWNQAKTAEVAPGQKVGFCLEDTQRRETNGPPSAVYINSNFCHQNNPNASSITMGVSAGWRDRYGASLALQWVNVSDVQPGVYWLAAEIDTDNVVAELDETNNDPAYASSSSTVPGYVATAVNAGTVPTGADSSITLTSQSFGSPGSRRFRIESLPAHGSLRSGATVLAVGSEISGSSVTYRPAGGYSGPDSFTFSANDSSSQFPRTPAAASVSMTLGQAPSQTAVAISGAPASLDIATSAQLTAAVTDGPPGVTWAVNGVTGGNTTVGTVTTSGLYQAPASVPAAGSVNVRATSTAEPSAFDEVSIGITDPGDPDPAPDPGTDYVANGSFETDLANWTTWQASLAREQLADAPGGVWVAKVTRTAGTAFTIDDSPASVTDASAGLTHTGRAFVKAASPSAVGKEVELFLREVSPSGTTLRSVAGTSVFLTATFQAVTSELVPLAAGNRIEIYVGLRGAGAGDAFYIDEITLTDGSAPPPPPPANEDPIASFDASSLTPAVGEEVSFTDTSSDNDGTIAGREWDLDGDGQFDDSTVANPTASYSAAGPVTVGLRVTDDGGATATATRELTVSAAPPPPPTSCQPGEFTAEYFANRDLAGAPVLTRCETEIANDWGTGSPAAEVPNDNFSARWTASEDFAAGDWRFTTRSDDGVRLFVDGAAVIDNWTDHGPTLNTALRTLTGGEHEVVVEYYENGVGAVAEASWQPATPPPPPTSCQPGEFTAEYFANRDLAGAPVLTRCETEIANDWGTGSPAAEVPNDNFSARWTASEDFAAGDWRFTTRSDDGVRLFVDGAAVIDNWTDHGPTPNTALRTLTGGEHEVVVEYYENGGGAVAEASWQPATPPPPPTSCQPGEFTAEYFANRDLAGAPVLTRCETEIANDWGTGSPAAEVPNDNFSARWTASEDFAAGDWRFTTRSDDGVRLFVDGAPVIDNWTDHGPTPNTALRTLTGGEHEVVVEYYERGGGAVAEASWQPTTPPPPPTSCQPGEFTAEYFANRDLAGAPVLTRCETEIANDWGTGSPAAEVPNDNFSARWTASEDFAAGDWRFTTRSDDGVRLFVDGAAWIDNWTDHAPQTNSALTTLAAGAHEVVVEYYERGGGAVAEASWALETPAPEL